MTKYTQDNYNNTHKTTTIHKNNYNTHKKTTTINTTT